MRTPILATLALFALFTATLQAQATRPPNVVVILIDDLGWTDLSCQGSTYYQTPNIDRLAASGVRFTDAYAACAVCSPTRAAVMTGRSPARTGVTDWIRARFQRPGGQTPAQNPSAYVGGRNRQLLCPPNPFWLEHDEVTLAEALKTAGYTSCHIGKWHLGDEAWYPQHQGFDENYGGCDYGQPPSYFDPYSNNKLAGIPHLKPRKTGEYLSDREGDEALAFIERNRDKPFFLYLAHYAVHTPIQAKKELTATYKKRKKTQQKNAKYAAMIHSVDDAVGKVLAKLEATGNSERTLVIFTSDNGGLVGPTHNAPLRSGKGFPYEGGIRVPLIIRWPGVTQAGTTSDQLATSVDIFPTVLEATALEATALDSADTRNDKRELDGHSLAPHLRNPKTTIARSAFWHFPHYRGSVTPYSIVRDGDWKLIKYYEGPGYELYNLADDLGETKNLAATLPGRVLQLNDLLKTQLKSQGAQLPEINPDYVKPSRVLIIGDSISMGYMQGLQQHLQRVAKIFRPTNSRGHPDNCAGTNKGIDNIDQWLSQHGGAWDVIHFNFGLHDLKRVKRETGKNSNDPSDPRQAEIDRYTKQLRLITAKLEATGAELIFATTTPVPKGVRPYRDNQDVLDYNRAAEAIMKEKGIPIDDLYGFVKANSKELMRPRDVHFSRDGSRKIAGQVAKTIRTALKKK